MKISINNLKKMYKHKIQALRNVNLEINNGMFGLLGPNGAGKTTLMRILVTLMNPSDGKIFVNDFDLQKERKEIRSMLGYLPQEFSTFPKLKTWEYLDYSARLSTAQSRKERNKAVEKMLEKVGLFEARDRQANKLSGGMKRRLGIAQALIGNPKILVVDEPTTGLDPEERIRFRNILAELSDEERIVILSTHIVGDISSTCRDMAMLSKGEIVFKGSPEELIGKAQGHVWQIHVKENELEDVKSKYSVIATIPSDAGWDVQVVCDKIEGYTGNQIEPGLEHAYVYFNEYIINQESCI